MKLPYGKSADLWSLGCMLFTMVTGRAPFESSDLRNTFSRVKKGQVTFPDGFPSLAKDLISRLIVLDPLQRISLEEIKRHPFLCPIEPISTINLRPIRQTTKHGTIELTQDGSVSLDFHADSAILLVSQHGERVFVYSKSSSHGLPNLRNPQAEYRYPDLPPLIRGRYEYVRRFISLLRSKTPQVVISSSHFKAYLMDNWPDCDLQIKYSNGNKTEYYPSAKKVVLKNSDGQERRLENISCATLEAISPIQTKILVEECLAKYTQCMGVAKHRSDMDGFPIIVKEPSAIGVYPLDALDITAPQLSKVLNEATLFVRKPTTYPSPPSINPFASTTGTTGIGGSAERSSTFEFVHKVFLPGVGWCLANAVEQFLLLFADGQTILLDGRRNRVAHYTRDVSTASAVGGGGSGSSLSYSGGSSSAMLTPNSPGLIWFPIDQHLPHDLKRKLVYFPKFVSSLKSGQGHSFVS